MILPFPLLLSLRESNKGKDPILFSFQSMFGGEKIVTPPLYEKNKELVEDIKKLLTSTNYFHIISFQGPTETGKTSVALNILNDKHSFSYKKYIGSKDYRGRSTQEKITLLNNLFNKEDGVNGLIVIDNLEILLDMLGREINNSIFQNLLCCLNDRRHYVILINRHKYIVDLLEVKVKRFEFTEQE